MARTEEVALGQVRDLLRDFPAFEFDVVAHLQSMRHGTWLRKAWTRTRAARDRLTPEHLVASTDDLRRRIPGYRGLPPVRTLDDIPLLTSQRLRADSLLFIDPAETDESLVMTTTSGTTGPSLRVLYTQHFHLRELFLAVPTALVRAGLDHLLATPFLTLHVTDSTRATAQVFSDPAGLFGLQARVPVAVGDPASVDRTLAMIEEFKPAAVTSRPELLGALLHTVRRRQGRNPFASVGCLVSSGSTLTPTLRADLSGLLGLPLVELYALTETGLTAAACPQAALHVEPSVVAETLADGTIVLSSLANAAMPILRYDSGDRGRLDDGCPCGSSTPRLALAPGRVVPCFHWPTGELFVPTALHDVFERFSVREFRVVQVSPDRLEITIEPATAAPPTLTADVAAAVTAMLPTSVTVAVSASDLPAGRPNDRYRSELA
ncbi:AMP-binding protein [Streptomyces erythrochromogenes]|uniref:AMP-binding protein n=1 Tax=Streptomyces erythrochromogenes TaxID=285574 RepID=UPI00363D4E56